MNFTKIINKVKWNEKGLVGAIVQDYKTKEILMFGRMNKETLKRTLKTGKMNFWKESKKRLWLKGEESGNFQFVKEVYLDCDGDTLLFKVKQVRGACHEGYKSCFFRKLNDGKIIISNERVFNPEEVYGVQIFNEVFSVIKDRLKNPKSNSYTSSLFKSGKEKIFKKLTEECTELILSTQDNSNDGIVWETADLLFHVMVLLAFQNVEFKEVYDELKKRRMNKDR